MLVQCPRCHLRHDLTGRPPGTAVSCRCGALMRLPPDGIETTALTCPQCGGQADKTHGRCLHCNSALATIRCPSCFGMAFKGNVHCPQCGDSLKAPAVVTHDTGRDPLPCPRCRNDLDATVIDKILVDVCAPCGGVWLDHNAFETLVQGRKFSDLSKKLNIPGYEVQPAKLKQSEKDELYVRCPICELFMHRRNYAKRSGIILDVCAAHGIWFDANELSRVFNYRIVDNDAASMRFKKENTSSNSKTTVIVRQSESSSVLGWGAGLEALAGLIATFFN